MMKEPTEAQIKEFWEWCGFKFTGGDWCYAPDRMHHLRRPPTIDLNNLFKYAVPRLMEYYKSESTPGYYQTANCRMENWVADWIDSDNGYDPALALFWAIKESL